MSIVPLPAGTIGSTSSLWSVDSNGQNLTNLIPGVGSTDRIMAYAGSVYIKSGSYLYKSDGTAAGTVLYAGAPNAAQMVTWAGIVNGNLYYINESYDQTAHETYGYLYEVDFSGNSHAVGGLYGAWYGPKVLNGQIYAVLDHYVPYSYQVYQITGTSATLVSNDLYDQATDVLPPAPASSVMVGGRNLYAFDDGTNGSELWINDGSSVKLAQDIFPGGGSSTPNNFTSIGGHAIFVASTPKVPELTATISGGTLFVGGSMIADNIVITSGGGITTVSMIKGADPNTLVGTFNDSDFAQIEVTAGDGDDRIDLSGTDKPAMVLGENGNDTIIGGAGHDTLNGGDDNDSIVGNLNEDMMDGGAGSNIIAAVIVQNSTPSPFSLISGVLRINGTGTADEIIVRPKSGDASKLEAIVQPLGFSLRPSNLGTFNRPDVTSIIVQADSGSDRITIDPAITIATRIYGGAGDDTIFGGGGADRVYGGDGNDWMTGNAGNDILYGEAGNDRIFGGDGKDYLDGGAGNNVLRGEGGQDRIFASKTKDDFRGNAGDLITLVM